jgi:hypothetical protein
MPRARKPLLLLLSAGAHGGGAQGQLTYPLDGRVLGVELSAGGHGRGETESAAVEEVFGVEAAALVRYFRLGM